MEYSTNTKINPNAQFYTVLTRENGRTAFVFVWDFFHWLTFDSANQLDDIKYVGTGKTRIQAMEIIRENLPGYQIRFKYCPRSCTW